jgi:hypothetical protein
MDWKLVMRKATSSQARSGVDEGLSFKWVVGVNHKISLVQNIVTREIKIVEENPIHIRVFSWQSQNQKSSTNGRQQRAPVRLVHSPALCCKKELNSIRCYLWYYCSASIASKPAMTPNQSGYKIARPDAR